MDRNLQQIRVLCGARSPNTISKRANSLLQFCLWHRGFYYRKHPIPFEQDILDKKALTRPRRKQARPLTVSEVIYLESVLRNPSIDLVDRFAAGAFLFALFGRCRWSVLRRVSNFFLDTNEVDGRTIGYMEVTTFSHKTAAQVARHGLPCLWWPRFGDSKSHVGPWNGTRLPRRSAGFSMTLSKVPSYQRQTSLATGDQGASPLQRHQSGFWSCFAPTDPIWTK